MIYTEASDIATAEATLLQNIEEKALSITREIKKNGKKLFLI